MSSALRIVNNTFESMGAYPLPQIEPAVPDSYLQELAGIDTADLVQRANGACLTTLDSHAIKEGINPIAHEVRTQAAIAQTLALRTAEAATKDEIDVPLLQALRLYDIRDSQKLLSFTGKVFTALWESDTSSYQRGALYFGAIGSGADSRKDVIVGEGDNAKPLSQLKAEILTSVLKGKSPETANVQVFANQLSDNYRWDVRVPVFTSRSVQLKRLGAATATAAVIGTTLASPAMAVESPSSPVPAVEQSIITAGSAVDIPAVEAVDTPDLQAGVVTTPAQPTPKYTVVTAGKASNQQVSPVSIELTPTAYAPDAPVTDAPLEQPQSEQQVVVATPTPEMPIAPTQSTDTMPETSTNTAMPNVETAAPETTVDSVTSETIAEQDDPITTQIKIGDVLIPAVRLGIDAKSVSVMQGGVAKPDNPKDKLSAGVIGVSNKIIEWITQTRDGDAEVLKIGVEGWQGWMREVAENPTEFSQDDLDEMQQIETQAMLYEEQGFPEKAAELRALAAFNFALQRVITDPSIYDSVVVKPAEPKPTPYKPDTSKNKFADFTLGPAELKVVDELAEHRHWKDWQKAIFIEVVTTAVRRAYVDHTSPVNETSQAVVESGDFKSSLTRKANNLHGIKGTGDAGTIEVPTSEWVDGHYVKIMDHFAAFSSVSADLKFFNSHLMQLKHYEDARWFFRNPHMNALGLQNQLNRKGAIVKPHYLAYATSPTYIQTLEDMIPSLRLREIIPAEFFSNSKIPYDEKVKKPKVEFEYKAFHDNKDIVIPGAEKAVARAIEITEADFNDPIYKEYCPGNYKDGKYVRCYNLCDHVVAYVWGNAHSGHKNAYMHWETAKDDPNAVVGTDREPPIGAMLYWGNSKPGHTAIYIGNGMIVSNDIGDRSHGIRGGMYVTKATNIEALWGKQYKGWAIDGRLMHVDAHKVAAGQNA